MSLGRGVPADILGAGSLPSTWGVLRGWVHAIDLSTPARCEGTVRTCTPGKPGPAAVSLQTVPPQPLPRDVHPGVLPWCGEGGRHPRAPSPSQAPPIHVLRRSPDGVPVQVYVPENGEIVTQV